MSKDVFVVGDNIISPLGRTTAENMDGLKSNRSGITLHDNISLSAKPFYASLLKDQDGLLGTEDNDNLSRFEQLTIASIKDALQASSIDIRDKKTVIVISSTKGNISLMEGKKIDAALEKRISLPESARLIADHFGSPNTPIIVSNACISGLVAILTGMRLLQSGEYENAIVVGCDIITKFILSGFQSLMAISPEPCKPYDASRDGISLGEAAGTVVLATQKNHPDDIKITGGSISNDANHISGPSRTGEELALVIRKALSQAQIKRDEIGFISAHGTATLFNDEMEAKAISISQLESTPVNSLKGNFGHTLGAAGLIESIATIHSLKENIILPTKNYKDSGVSKPINICSTLQHCNLMNALKTASGFGGCNAAIVFSKVS
jgi:3-oxoacyl-[acyl-carrier-protein] synthase I